MKVAPFEHRDNRRMLLFIHELFFFVSEALGDPRLHTELEYILNVAEEVYRSAMLRYRWKDMDTLFLGLAVPSTVLQYTA
jgi:hypothetical protein